LINKTKKTIIIFLMFLMFIPILKVKANNDQKPPEPIKILGGGQIEGNNVACGNPIGGYTACYISGFRFRVTMVDENGNKVAGTNSVDFRISTDSRTKTTVLKKSDLSNFELVNNQYKYKYGQNDDPNTFKFVQLYIDGFDISNYTNPETKQETFEKYKEFMNAFMDRVKDRNDKGFYYNSAHKIDFLTLFLTYNGYIEQKNSEWIEIDNLIYNDKKKAIIDNNYYMLIEPTYYIYYNETPWGVYNYRYGTASEIMEFWDNKITNREKDYLSEGYLAGLSLNFVYNAGCNMTTTTSDATSIGFKRITEDPKCNDSDKNGPGYYRMNSEGRELRPPKMKSIYQENTKGYGAFVTRLYSEPGTDENHSNLKMKSDLCATNQGRLTTTLETDNEFVFSTYPFKTSTASTDSAAYCTDEINYNFSNLISKLSYDGLNPQKSGTIIGKDAIGDAGTLTVIRKCTAGPNISSSANDFEDISMFKNVTLHIYDDNYILNADTAHANIKEIKSKYDTGATKKYEITINYSLDEDINVKSSDVNGDGEGYLSFEDNMSLYGYNNKLAEKYAHYKSNFRGSETIFAGRSIGKSLFVDYTFDFKSSTDETNYFNVTKNLCKFETKVSNKKISERVFFRTIDLKNPFPARDGRSRLPGVNWLGQNNYVYDSIIKNREVSDYSVYDMEPMYKVTLTPSKMVEIREYNKNKTYSDINLTCTNGVMCRSEFLKTLGNESLQGTCAMDYLRLSSEDKNGYEKTQCAVNTESGKTCYFKTYDSNNDGLVNLEDLTQRIDFYTCGNKTPISGGY